MNNTTNTYDPSAEIKALAAAVIKTEKLHREMEEQLAVLRRYVLRYGAPDACGKEVTDEQ